MRTIQGVKFSDEEVKEFQDRFLASPAASAVGKVLDSVLAQAQQTLESCGAGNDAIRQAQGMVLAVRMVDEFSLKIQNVNLDEEEVLGEDNLNEEEVVDVDF
jgi:hypothetical protein